jgi:uncharacterized protein (TIGR00369 family)
MLDNSPEAVREMVAASPFHVWFGLRVSDISEGRCDIELDVTPDHRNLIGTTHGGVVSTMADTAIGLAVRTTLSEGSRHVTTQLNVTYLEKVDSGRLLARGRVLRSGRRFAYGEADVIDENNKLVARATATFAVLPAQGS